MGVCVSMLYSVAKRWGIYDIIFFFYKNNSKIVFLPPFTSGHSTTLYRTVNRLSKSHALQFNRQLSRHVKISTIWVTRQVRIRQSQNRTTNHQTGLLR